MRTPPVLVVVCVLSLAACSTDRPDSSSTGDVASSDAAAIAGNDGPTFSEVATEAGLTETQSDLGFSGEDSQSAAAAVADVDGDGDLDVFLPRVGKPNGLYINAGDGTFTDDAARAGVAGPTDRFGSSASVFFDIEGDGDLDLFASGAGAGADQLFVNDGSGSFTDEAVRRGLDRPVEQGVLDTQQHGATVADVNRDGHMDLLVLQWRAAVFSSVAFDAAAKASGWDASYRPTPCEIADVVESIGYPMEEGTPPARSALYINDGTGHFSDQTEMYGLALDEVVAFTGVFNDLDADGWPDLVVTGDGCTSRLYRNLDGTRFEDITDSAGVGTDENGMGAIVRDVDGNGTPDWFITSIYWKVPEGQDCPKSSIAACSGNRLYLNDGRGEFTDATDEFGVRDSGWGWGAAIEDFANSGTLDLVATNGFRLSSETDPQDEFMGSFANDATRFMRRSGHGPDAPFVDVAEDVGIVDNDQGHALVPFDMDSDGDLDLLIAQSNDTPLLYRNDTPPDRSWLTISLDDPAHPGNRWGDGARVEIIAEHGAEPTVDWVGTGGSYESQKPPVIHHGFGDRSEPIARIDVYWPGATEPQSITDVALDQHLVIERTG